MYTDRRKWIGVHGLIAAGEGQRYLSIKGLQKRHSEGRSQLGGSALKSSKTTCQSTYVSKPNQ